MDLVVPVAMKLTSFNVDFLDLGGGYLLVGNLISGGGFMAGLNRMEGVQDVWQLPGCKGRQGAGIHTAGKVGAQLYGERSRNLTMPPCSDLLIFQAS